MFIALKDSKIIAISDLEWACRREAKGLIPAEYSTWLETVTTKDENGVKTYDFSGEDYDIHECKGKFESWFATGLIVPQVADVTLYHLKWDGNKVVKDDAAVDAYKLSQVWKRIRAERNRLLSESDWTQGGDSPLTTQKKSDWAKYRTSLRTLPEDQSSKTKYSDITWPTKPS